MPMLTPIRSYPPGPACSVMVNAVGVHEASLVVLCGSCRGGFLSECLLFTVASLVAPRGAEEEVQEGRSKPASMSASRTACRAKRSARVSRAVGRKMSDASLLLVQQGVVVRVWCSGQHTGAATWQGSAFKMSSSCAVSVSVAPPLMRADDDEDEEEEDKEEEEACLRSRSSRSAAGKKYGTSRRLRMAV